MHEARWQLAVATTGLGTWEVDGSTGEHLWSPEFLAICGLPPSTRPATDLFSALIHPDDRARVNEAYAAAYRPGSDGGYEAEFRIHRADTGEERWVLARGLVRLDTAGRLVQATGLLLDTTARRQVERALLESEERYRLAVASFQGAVYETDLRTGYAYRAHQAYAMLGVSEAEVEPTREWWHQRVHPDDLSRLLRVVEDAIAGRIANIDCQYRIRHASGSWVWIWHRGLVARDPYGQPARLTGAFLDITAQKQAEAMNARLAAIMSTSADAIVGFAAEDGRILAWNRGAEALFGYTEDEALGAPVSLLVDPDHLTEVENQTGVFDRAMREGEVRLEAIRRRKDETRVEVSITATRIVDASGRVLGVSAIFRDITRRRQAERHQRLLINELNHRVKNTLATVQSIAAQTFRGDASASGAREAFEARLMALSRAHNVLTRENWEGARLREVVDNAVAPYRGPGDARFLIRGADIRVAPRMALALAMALHELATNASKYGALSVAGGAVSIVWSTTNTPTGRLLVLRWEESGGPAVEAPTRTGFGTRLIERQLALEFGGGLRLEFRREGVVCIVETYLSAEDAALEAADSSACS